MYKKLKSVQVCDNFNLDLFYTSGEVRSINMSKYFDIPPYDRLKDINIFKQVTVSFDTIKWPSDIDIDPEILLKESVLVSK